MRRTKFYKKISILSVLVLFLLVIIFSSESALAQEVNLALDGTPIFTLTENDNLDNIYSNAPDMNDDDIGTRVGFYALKESGGHYVGGTYEAVLEFADPIPTINKIEFYRYWQMTDAHEPTGYERTYLEYNYDSVWNLIDTRSYSSLGSSTGTIEITAGAPWSDVTKIKVVARMNAYTFAWQDTRTAHYLYELRAFGPAAPSFQDIGLRMQAPSGTVLIAAEIGTPTSPLRIAKNGVIYGIVLVDTSDPDASSIRIQTNSGIKALRKIGSGGPSSHWQEVDDVVPDEFATYVWTDSGTEQKDAYNIEDPSVAGAINQIRVWVRFQGRITTHLRLNGVESVFPGSGTAGGGWSDQFTGWQPSRPGGGSWTWSDIRDLQVGIGLSAWTIFGTTYQGRLTQIYIEVDYSGGTLTLRPDADGDYINIDNP